MSSEITEAWTDLVKQDSLCRAHGLGADWPTRQDSSAHGTDSSSSRADAVAVICTSAIERRSEMIQQSMLLETLATVRKRIQQIRERKETIGEENTKATLIEPVF